MYIKARPLVVSATLRSFCIYSVFSALLIDLAFVYGIA